MHILIFKNGIGKYVCFGASKQVRSIDLRNQGVLLQIPFCARKRDLQPLLLFQYFIYIIYYIKNIIVLHIYKSRMVLCSDI